MQRMELSKLFTLRYSMVVSGLRVHTHTHTYHYDCIGFKPFAVFMETKISNLHTRRSRQPQTKKNKKQKQKQKKKPV